MNPSNLKKIIKTLLIIGFAGMVCACSSSVAVVDPTTLLAYGINPNEQNLENLAKNYGSTINKNRKSGIKTPGLYCDYAVALVKQGKRAEANSWFNKEIEAFPSAREFVMQLKKELIPEYANDNRITTDEASEVEGEEPTSLPPATRAAAEERAATVMEPTNSIMDPEETPAENEETMTEEEKEEPTEPEKGEAEK